VVAGAGHLWQVERDVMDASTNWRRKRGSVVVSTVELAYGPRRQNGGGTGSDRIPVCAPVLMPPRRLTLDPYLLGVWLGDGATDSGCFYAAEQDFAHFAPLGRLSGTMPAGGARKQDFHRIVPDGLQFKLRSLGLLGNKHIPLDYMEASVEQRVALLQGLMDTDGTCVESGSCSYTSVLPGLIDQIKELLASLGVKAYVRSRFTMCNGRQYGPHYRLTFTPPVGMSVFRLPRKQARVRGSISERTRNRYIDAIEPVGLREVKCIQVEGGLYLAGRDFVITHNSLLSSVFWPAWEWGPAGLPHHRFLSFSYSDRLSIRDNRRTRILVESEWFQARWPMALVGDQNAKTLFENEHRGSRMASSVGGLGTGARADRLIVDDPHHVADGESVAKMERSLLWFRETLPTRVNSPEKSAIVVIMQRVHESDISGEIISRELGYEHLMLPMRYEPERHCVSLDGRFQDWRTKDGELLFPSRYPAEVVDKLEHIMGSYATSAQMQQRPAPRGGGLIQVDKIPVADAWPADAELVRAWDFAATAASKGGDPDYSVGAKVAMKDGRAWLVDVVRGRWSPGELETVVAATAHRDMDRCRIVLEQEGGSSGVAFVDHYMRKVLLGFTVSASRPTGSKAQRALPFAAAVEAGNVMLVRGDWNDAWIGEARTFPLGAHDDQVDATVSAWTTLANAPAFYFA
jgi:predicted phage terminase large subunit-like protein